MVSEVSKFQAAETMVSGVLKFQAAETMVSGVLKVLKVILVDSCVISPSPDGQKSYKSYAKTLILLPPLR